MSKPTPLAQKFIDYLGCPCKYYRAGKPLQFIRAEYEDAYARRKEGGYTPLMIVPDESLANQLDEVMSNFREGENSEQYRIRLLSEQLPDAHQWFLDGLNEMKSANEEYWNEITSESDIPGVKVNMFTGFKNEDKRGSKEVILAKIPTVNPWEVFAWLPLGKYRPELMMSVSRYWFQKFYASPAIISGNTLEYAAVPIPDKGASVGVALEQYVFCNEIVDEGTQSIGTLADTLMKSTIWNFRWE